MEFNANCASIRDSFPWEALLADYEWDAADLEGVYEVRNALEASLQGWIRKGFPTGEGLKVADDILRWGFGKGLPSQPEDWEETFRTAVERLITDEISEAVEVLLIGSNRLGIASVSKLLTFVEQTQFGIYDSRVAYALRNVTNGAHRVFPCPAWRANDQVTGDNAITRSPNKAVVAGEAYESFVRWARRSAECLGTHHAFGYEKQWSPSFIEMALFMAGRVRCQDTLQELRLRRFAGNREKWFPRVTEHAH